MNMKTKVNKMRLAKSTAVLAILATPCLWAGEFSYTGNIGLETAISTTGERTQAADAGTEFDNQGRDINLAALRLEMDSIYRINRQTSLTGRFRAWGDWTNKLDSAYKEDADLFAGDDFPGNSWLLAVSSNNYVIDIPELYLDYFFNNFWLRIGKQQIAWGDALGMRILDDMISSLDVRRHGGIYGLATEEFLDERIGQNGVRGNARIGNNWEIEASITDFFPTIVYPAGSAYANLPGSVVVLNDDGVREARDKPAYGLRALGSVLNGQGQLTLAYTRRPQSVGVLKFEPASGLGPLLTTGELALTADHPRIDTFGGAFSYSFSADPVGPYAFFNGLIARIEAAYYLDKKYTNSAPATVLAPPGVLAPPTLGPIPLPQPIPFAGEVIQDDELSIGFVIEKDQKLSPNWLSTFFLFQGWYRSKSDLNDMYQSLVGKDDWKWWLLSITQPFINNELSTTLTVSHDLNGGWFVQPVVSWRPNQRISLDVSYNWFKGGTDDVFGPSEPNEELALRLRSFF